MINNFDEVKKQLKELAEVVNAFKSEAVQLRIVELVFGFEPPEENRVDLGNQIPNTSTKSETKRKSKEKTVEQDVKKKTPKRASGSGAPATLSNLLTDGFFKKPKSIGDIVEHCEHNLARKFKQNEFSGKLARMVREKLLKRGKNTDGQYEYQNP